MNEVARSNGTARFGSVAAALAALLPLYLIVNGAPLGAVEPADFARIHLQPGFAWRAALTLLYFPAVLAAYYASPAAPLAPSWLCSVSPSLR